MLGGSGVYKGSTFLISGTSGSGKTSLSASFVDSVCRRGEKSLYVSFEESPDQICRNMRSIGIDLDQWIGRGLLKFHAVRPTLFGLEMHLLMISNYIRDFNPSIVIMDPISSLMNIGDPEEVKAIIARIIDIGKSRNTMVVLTNLSHGAYYADATTIGISSICDIWILMKQLESDGEFNRGIYVLKARGMNHTNQVREFRMSPTGIEILDIFVGAGGKTGAARFSEEAGERAAALVREQEIDRLKRQVERKELILNRKIDELKMNFESEKEELMFSIQKDELREAAIRKFRDELLAKRRG
jgi:circadian clock protein KaiC